MLLFKDRQNTFFIETKCKTWGWRNYNVTATICFTSSLVYSLWVFAHLYKGHRKLGMVGHGGEWSIMYATSPHQPDIQMNRSTIQKAWHLLSFWYKRENLCSLECKYNKSIYHFRSKEHQLQITLTLYHPLVVV